MTHLLGKISQGYTRMVIFQCHVCIVKKNISFILSISNCSQDKINKQCYTRFEHNSSTEEVVSKYFNGSSSSCHQTSVFHLSTHFFAVSLNLLRSSNEQGCSRRVHCIMCAVFSVARPHSQVASPS